MLSAIITVQIHQIMKMKEEFEALKQQRDTRNAKEPEERSASLMAACPSTCLQVRDHHACMPAYCLNLATSLSIMTAPGFDLHRRPGHHAVEIQAGCTCDGAGCDGASMYSL